MCLYIRLRRAAWAHHSYRNDFRITYGYRLLWVVPFCCRATPHLGPAVQRPCLSFVVLLGFLFFIQRPASLAPGSTLCLATPLPVRWLLAIFRISALGLL